MAFLSAYTKKLQKLCLNLYQGAYRSQRVIGKKLVEPITVAINQFPLV